FAPVQASPLMSVPERGGMPTPATALEPARGITSHRFPVFLPDGNHFVYMATSADSSALPVGGIHMAMVGSKEHRMIVEAGPNEEPLTAPMFADGYLLFQRQSTLMAQRLNQRTWNLEGERIVVASDVTAA